MGCGDHESANSRQGAFKSSFHFRSVAKMRGAIFLGQRPPEAKKLPDGRDKGGATVQGDLI